MSLFTDKQAASLLLSAKANAIGHTRVGRSGRALTNVVLGASALLSYIASYSGLNSLVSKGWVSIFALAAGLSTTAAIFLLTTLKPGDHLQAGSAYENIYLRTVNEGENDTNLAQLRSSFIDIVSSVGNRGIALSRHATENGEKKARADLHLEPPQADLLSRDGVIGLPKL